MHDRPKGHRFISWASSAIAIGFAASLTAATPASALETQWITFAPISPRLVTDGTFQVSPIASSGLPVSLSPATPLVCTVNGTTIWLLDLGTCTINANQAGDDTYAAADEISRSFTVFPVPGSNDTTTTTLTSTTTNHNETIKGDVLTTTLTSTTTNTNDTVYHKYETITTNNTNVTLTHSGPGWGDDSDWSSSGSSKRPLAITSAVVKRTGGGFTVKVRGQDSKAGRTISLVRKAGKKWVNVRQQQIRVRSGKVWSAKFKLATTSKKKVRLRASNGQATVKLTIGLYS